MSADGTAAPAQARYAPEALRCLRAAIRQLPPGERDVFLLRETGGLTYDQIARLHTCPVEVVKDRMRSALRKLRPAAQDALSGGF